MWVCWENNIVLGHASLIFKKSKILMQTQSEPVSKTSHY